MRRNRPRGHPTEYLGIRVPKELADAARDEGPNQSQGCIALMDLGFEAKRALGKEWIEVIIRAHREGVTEGEAVGRMLKDFIDSQRKGKR